MTGVGGVCSLDRLDSFSSVWMLSGGKIVFQTLSSFLLFRSNSLSRLSCLELDIAAIHPRSNP